MKILNEKIFDRAHIKERFLNDLRKAREQYSGPELVKVSIHMIYGRRGSSTVVQNSSR